MAVPQHGTHMLHLYGQASLILDLAALSLLLRKLSQTLPHLVQAGPHGSWSILD
jgi:hypothetical protein